MSKTVRHFKGNGTQKEFNFGMDYLQKNFIYLTVDKVDKIYGSDYVISDQDIIILVAPAMDVDVIIKRTTSTKPLVTWKDATVLTASDMTMSEVQLLHIAEEQADIAEGGRGDQDYKIDRCLHLEGDKGSSIFPEPVPTKGFRWNATGDALELTADPEEAIRKAEEMMVTMQKAIDSVADLKSSKTVDGGNARSIYTDTQVYDGGNAHG